MSELDSKPVLIPKTPWEYYEHVMETSEVDPAMTALTLNDDVAAAYNFYFGYLENLSQESELYRSIGEYMLHGVVKNKIHVAAFSGITQYEMYDKTPFERLSDALGVWPRVFEAIEIQLAAERKLK